MTETAILAGLIATQLLLLAGIIVLFRRTAGSGFLALSDDEAEAEAYLTNTVERLLQDLEQSADRATAGLAAQRAALEALLAQAPAAADLMAQESGGTAPAAPVSPDGSAGSTPAVSLSEALASRSLSDSASEEMPARNVATPAPASGWVGQALDLARGGLTSIEIARQVGRGEAEVRLALAAGELE